MRQGVLTRTVLVLFCIFWSDLGMAWDVIGHRVVGEVASRYLDPGIKKKIHELLQGRSLAEVSTWADEIKSEKQWDHAGPWHYVNVAPGKSYETSKKSAKGDIVSSILRFQAVLARPSAKPAEKEEAIKFLVHLVGDIHQPLHSGYEHDKGGNEVKVSWFQESSNLHRVWDEHLVDFQKLSYTEMTQFIDRTNPENIKGWRNTTVMDWMNESRAYLPQVYEFKSKKLGYEYNHRHWPYVKERLLQAGIRLAQLLNTSLK